MVPAAAPPPTAIIPAPVDAVLPRPIPNFPSSPAMPLPLAVPIPASSASKLKLPIALPARDETALRVSCPITALPMSTAPLPTDRTGFASFDRKKAENSEDISADSPPGRSFPALFTIFPKTPVNFDVTALRSKPSENPFANDFPILTPSFTLSDTSIPRSISRDVEMPVPIAFPKSAAFSASMAFPVVFHHSPNGSAISSSHAIFTFPRKSAFCQSSDAVISPILSLNCSTFTSTQSIISSSADWIAGICPVSQSAKLLTYGDSLSPNDIFTPSSAL